MRPVLLLVLTLALAGLIRPAGVRAEAAWMTQAGAMALADGYALVDTAGLKALLASPRPPLLLDVRPDYEYRDGHIPGALNLEFEPGLAGDLPRERRDRLFAVLGPDKDREIVVYCRSFQ